MTQLPLVSIIIPTLNSTKLALTLDSIKKQTYPADRLEILIVDGGSKDDTCSLGEKYGARIVPNPRVQPECAKHEGMLAARGDIAIFIDSDEAFSEVDAIQKRVQLIQENPDCHIVLTDGYLKPDGYDAINDYINIFSDPFSFFIYHKHSSHELFMKNWEDYVRKTASSSGYTYAIDPKKEQVPLVDLCAGNALDLSYVRKYLSSELGDVSIVSCVFYDLLEKTHITGIVKDSPIIHYSPDTLSRYIHKLAWRVIANIHHSDQAGTGYSNREKQGGTSRFRKYLFLPYSLSFFLPLCVGIWYALRFQKPILILHGPLSWYVGWMICWQMFLKILGKKTPLKAYGQKQ